MQDFLAPMGRVSEILALPGGPHDNSTGKGDSATRAHGFALHSMVIGPKRGNATEKNSSVSISEILPKALYQTISDQEPFITLN